MTLQAYAANPVRPLVFVPVYIGYEKLMEGRSYLAELGGQNKRAESLAGLLMTVRRLRREFGKVHVNFGEPIQAADMLAAASPDWRRLATDAPRELRPAIDQAAFTLASRINAAAVVNPINFVALACADLAADVMDQSLVHTRIAHLQAIHAAGSYPGVSIASPTDPEAALTQAIRLGFLSRDPATPDRLHQDAEARDLLAYFRNNVIHLFALPATIACLISHHRYLSQNQLDSAMARIYPLLHGELFLPWDTPGLNAATAAAAASLASRGMLQRVFVADGWCIAGDEASAPLEAIGALIYPLLEPHYASLDADIREAVGRYAIRGDTVHDGGMPLERQI
jgi:glycerol-3-phosphate O-acyltransferase